MYTQGGALFEPYLRGLRFYCLKFGDPGHEALLCDSPHCHRPLIASVQHVCAHLVFPVSTCLSPLSVHTLSL